jgi:hypothetical protein
MRRVALFICGLKLMADPTQMTPEAQGQRWSAKGGEFAKCVQDHVMAPLMRLEPSDASPAGACLCTLFLVLVLLFGRLER